jgi:signal transduction histidine kinase/ActR/RegA family two-component response regulator
MLDRTFDHLKRWSGLRVFLAILAFSTLGSLVLVSAMSWLFHGQWRLDYAITGLVTASVVSVLVALVVSRLIQMLQRAEAQARAANASKSTFLANMSHEIRTPLNAITGMAHLIRRSSVNPEQDQRLDKLEAAGRHLLGIVEAVLDHSKIEAGEFQLDEAEVRIQSLVGNVLSMVHERAQAKRLTLRTDLPPLPERLRGDPMRLQQALLNYVANAVKFTEAGEIVLRVVVLAESADSIHLRFEVQDQGMGIDAATLAELFQPFKQADTAITRQFGGTGLGLTITRRIAQMMGGEAGASSEPGLGSTFWFTAHLLKGSVQSAPPVAPRPEPAEDTLQREHAGQRVLVVEDEPVNREITAYILQGAGLVVEMAEDGHAGLRKLEEASFDIVLMDVQMPQLDGLEATRRLRQRPGLATLPVVALTANAFAEDRAACLAAGMNDFISKPVNPEALLCTVLRWLPPQQAH